MTQEGSVPLHAVVPRPLRLTVGDAQTLHLAAQGLIQRPDGPITSKQVLAAIRRMGALQIDSISIVARSPYLVLWSRLGAYDPVLLEDLLTRGSIFEYWSHAACFLPIEDWPIYRRDMEQGRTRSRTWLNEHTDVAERVLDRIRSNGPVRSSDWEREGGAKGAGWWDWKPEKIALEALFATGEVMVSRRHNFQRVYDLRERVLPPAYQADLLSEDEARRLFALKTVQALGIAKAKWVPDYFKRPVKDTPQLLERLADEGVLLRAEVDGWNVPAYVHPEHAPLARRIARGGVRHDGTTLLSPFDPVVWDRARLLDLWNFHYRIEVYTPAHKRRYGYFTLPILHRGRLIGRLDPKAHRDRGVLEVRQLHLQEDVELEADIVEGVAHALISFAAWQRLTAVEVGQSDPPDFAARLRDQLSALPTG